MAAYTLAQAQAKLEEVQKAITACLLGKTYNIDGVSVSRENLKDLEARERRWEQIVASLSGAATNSRVRYPVFSERGS